MTTNTLEEVTKILAERENDYGDAETMLTRIAVAWTAYLGYSVTSADVTRMMSMFKMLRATGGDRETKQTRDDDLDAIGYLLLGVSTDG